MYIIEFIVSLFYKAKKKKIIYTENDVFDDNIKV